MVYTRGPTDPLGGRLSLPQFSSWFSQTVYNLPFSKGCSSGEAQGDGALGSDCNVCVQYQKYGKCRKKPDMEALPPGRARSVRAVTLQPLFGSGVCTSVRGFSE